MSSESETLWLVSADGTECRVLQEDLSKQSDYFRGLLNSGMREVTEGKVVLPEVSAIGLRQAVDFMQGGKLAARLDDVSDVLKTSTYLQITALTDSCVTFLTEAISIQNCVMIYDLAEEFLLFDLQAVADHFMLENLTAFVKTESFKSIGFDRMMYLLDNDDANVESEFDIFEAAMTWLRHKELLQETSLAEKVFNTVRYPLMNMNEIVECQTFLKSLKTDNSHLMNSLEGAMNSLEGAKESLCKLQISLTRGSHCRPRCQTRCVLALGGFTGSEHSTNRIQVVTVQDLQKTEVELKFRSTRLTQNNLKLPQPLCEHCVAVMDGLVYVAGGQSQYCQDGRYTRRNVYRWDPAIGSWQEICSMEKPRSLFYMGPLGGALYSVGGWIAPDTVTRSVERYVPTEDTWERVSSLDVGLHEHAGSPHRGLLFISGGFKGPYRGHLNTVWALDPEVNTWSQKASMLHARSYHSMVSTASHILVAGGVNYVGEDTFEDVRECELYDPDADQWTVVTRAPRFASCMSWVTFDQKLYLFGGHSFETASDHSFLQIYDFMSRKWTERTISSNKINFYACLSLKLPRKILNQFKPVCTNSIR